MTFRAVNVLKSVDLILAEDTRTSSVLLKHYDIHGRLESHHKFNEHKTVPMIRERILAGLDVALISDAGTPGISDPGFLLVREAVRAGIAPVVVPGVSALTFAVTASALPVDRFAFLGFPPVKSGRRRKFFESIRGEGKSVFFFESPHRIARTLPELAEIVGGDAQLAVIREATKLHEEILRGSAAELAALAGTRDWRGEFVIGVHPPELPEASGEEEPPRP